MAENHKTSAKEALHRCLEDFKKDLKGRDAKNFQDATLESLEETIGQLQKKQHFERRQRSLARLARFLEAVNEYGKVIEVFCNSNIFVPFVWVSENQRQL